MCYLTIFWNDNFDYLIIYKICSFFKNSLSILMS